MTFRSRHKEYMRGKHLTKVGKAKVQADQGKAWSPRGGTGFGPSPQAVGDMEGFQAEKAPSSMC